MSEKDFIIIGQGLAGTITAHTIEKYKKTFVIIDRPDMKSSSNIAAGILNPISFKRCIHSWKASILSPFSILFYEEMNKKLNTNSFIPLNVIRLFNSFEEQNNWLSKTGDLRYNLFLGDDNIEFSKTNFNIPYGYGTVKSCGRLMVKDFIKSSFNHFKNYNSVFNSTKLAKPIPKINGWYHCGKYRAKNIIYCEGADVIKNTLFNYLPIIPNKGELLKINCSSIPKKLISKGVYSVPDKDKNIFTIGSTYDHRDRSHEPTIKAKKYLLSKFNAIGNFKYTVINQEVGFRPTTNDRRAVIGEHPILKNSYILNGLGSKGVMSAPWIANNLIRHIIFNEVIDDEVDISRHRKKISEKNISFALNLCNS